MQLGFFAVYVVGAVRVFRIRPRRGHGLLSLGGVILLMGGLFHSLPPFAIWLGVACFFMGWFWSWKQVRRTNDKSKIREGLAT